MHMKTVIFWQAVAVRPNESLQQLFIHLLCTFVFNPQDFPWKVRQSDWILIISLSNLKSAKYKAEGRQSKQPCHSARNEALPRCQGSINTPGSNWQITTRKLRLAHMQIYSTSSKVSVLATPKMSVNKTETFELVLY